MRGRGLIIGGFAVAPLVAVAAIATYVVPQFLHMFEFLGFELPLETRILLATYRYWGLLALGAAAIAWVHRGSLQLLTRVLIGSWILSVLLLVYCGVACYSPIYRLATAA